MYTLQAIFPSRQQNILAHKNNHIVPLVELLLESGAYDKSLARILSLKRWYLHICKRATSDAANHRQGIRCTLGSGGYQPMISSRYCVQLQD